MNYFQLRPYLSLWWTIAKYKSLLFVCYKEYLEVNPVLFDGAGIIVEVDEDVLSHRENYK